MTGLWEGCSRGDMRLVKKHLDRGVDVNYHKWGSSCLMIAVENQNEEIVSLLLQQRGIHVNYKFFYQQEMGYVCDGETALHRAATRSTPAILRLLLDYPGIDKEAKTKAKSDGDCGE